MSSSAVFAAYIEMTCQHSFQGNYSGGGVLLKFQENFLYGDKAYIRWKGEWIEICSNAETYGKIQVSDFRLVVVYTFLIEWIKEKGILFGI